MQYFYSYKVSSFANAAGHQICVVTFPFKY